MSSTLSLAPRVRTTTCRQTASGRLRPTDSFNGFRPDALHLSPAPTTIGLPASLDLADFPADGDHFLAGNLPDDLDAWVLSFGSHVRGLVCPTLNPRSASGQAAAFASMTRGGSRARRRAGPIPRAALQPQAIHQTLEFGQAFGLVESLAIERVKLFDPGQRFRRPERRLG